MAGNVVQFIDFGMKLCCRIEEYSATAGAPKKLMAQANCLSDLLKVLDGLQDTEQGLLERGLVSRCAERAKELSNLLDTLIDKDHNKISKWRYARKAWKSLRSDKKVEGLQRALESLLGPLSLHLQVKMAQQTLTIKCQNEQILLQQAIRSNSNVGRNLTSKDCKQSWHTSDQCDIFQVLINFEIIAILPIARNPDFVGREWLLHWLDEQLSQKSRGQPKAALHGLGGIGKSQIALEYVYRFLEQSPKCSVFWVFATNTSRFEEVYRRIAFEYEIPGREDPKGDLMQLVRNWLETKYKGTWLMVVDNVDDINVFFKEKNSYGKSLSEYIPQSPKGAILYTTRDRSIGVNLVPPRSLIGVPRMDPIEARDLLGEKVMHKSTKEEQFELLEGLDYLPLAISQAAAFMTEVGLTISQYLTHYRHSDSARTRLLSYGFVDHGREERPMESIVTTWMISFNYIRKHNPRAADILALMSFLDRQEIPKSLLVYEGEDTLDFSKAVGMLDAFSLIAINDHRDNYRMHRLVQLATRIWLSRGDEGVKKASLALDLVARYLPSGEYKNWATCAVYLPHAEAILHSGCEEYPNANLKARATILLNASWYFRNRGQFERAETKADMSFRLREKILGPKHPDTLVSVSNLAAVLHDQGRYRAAEVMNLQALQGRLEQFGGDHPQTLVSFSNLASVLQDQGRHKEAEDMSRKALKGHEKVLGNQHPDTLASLGNLALVLQQQGKFEEAEKMHRQALKGSIEALGAEHPDTLVSLHNLAEVLRDQALYEEAEEVHRQALEGAEKVLGEEHPFTLTGLHNLAEVLRHRGKHSEAEETHRRALEGSEKVLGSVHPYTLTSLHNLAELLRDEKKFDEAEKMHRLALERRRGSLGGAHLDTLTSADCLALVLQDRERYKEAEKVNRQVPKGYEEVGRVQILWAALAVSHSSPVLVPRYYCKYGVEYELPVAESIEKSAGKGALQDTNNPEQPCFRIRGNVPNPNRSAGHWEDLKRREGLFLDTDWYLDFAVHFKSMESTRIQGG
ncbi:hypothetical protein FGG08_007027 [Glutinoglossum americanum]|uniref:Kinesin light chain n=1 Tax=Glutinoglossum americanum TaxID=1670608 RepID=A0A9P8HRI6_9PEZI|nr:hypothetical protein FGG08_007027 [Glutinoglossum americanum]